MPHDQWTRAEYEYHTALQKFYRSRYMVMYLRGEIHRCPSGGTNKWIGNVSYTHSNTMGDKSIYYSSTVPGLKDGETYDPKDPTCLHADVLDKSIYPCCSDWSMDTEIDEDEPELNKWKTIVENYHVTYESDFWNRKAEEILRRRRRKRYRRKQSSRPGEPAKRVDTKLDLSSSDDSGYDTDDQQKLVNDDELGNETEDGLDGYDGDNEETAEGKNDEINSEVPENQEKLELMMLRTLAIKARDSREAYEKRKEGEETKDEPESDDGWVVPLPGDPEREALALKFLEYVLEPEPHDHWPSHVRRTIARNINSHAVAEDVSCQTCRRKKFLFNVIVSIYRMLSKFTELPKRNYMVSNIIMVPFGKKR